MSTQEANWTTTQVIATGVITAAVAAAAVAGAIHFLGGGGDEDERPPIIVSNGSLDIDIDDHPKGQGLWVGTGTSYHHEHPNLAPAALQLDTVPRKQTVCSVTGTAAPLFSPPLTAQQLTIHFGKISDAEERWEAVLVRIVNGFLQVDFADNAELVAAATSLTKRKGKPDLQIRKVVIGSYTCTFNASHANTKLKIYQLK